MSQPTQPPETDLLVPLPAEGEQWDPHTVHTHYFGFAVPEADLGFFLYIRYLPYYPASQGGVQAYQRLDNLATTDCAYYDYEITMPWPTVEGNRFTTANGLSVDFVEPGRLVDITYRSRDGRTSIDVRAAAISPLVARGHVIPGEELRQVAESGGSEQFMHYTGEVVIHGERYEVDSYYPRDRSWRQVRSESREANRHPPTVWTPIYFGEDLAFNQVGIEAADTDPDWLGIYDLPPDAPTYHFAWVSRDGDLRPIVSVRRTVTATHPLLFAPLAMELEAMDDEGDEYQFSGEAIAFAPMMMWPNIASFDSVFRWEDRAGREAFGSVQTMHVEAYAHAMKERVKRPVPS
jgi:hypothetical protein